MNNRKGIGTLIVTLIVGILIGTTIGEMLGLFLPADHIVVKALVSPLFSYVAGPWDLNVIILVLTVGFTLHINFFSIIGIVGAWYYHKYSY